MPPSGVAALLPLLGEVGDLKRLQVAGRERSLMAGLFLDAWAELAAGAALPEVARRLAASALMTVRLPGYDAALLELDVEPGEALLVLLRGFDDAAGPLDARLREELRDALRLAPSTGRPPPFALRLAEQPRAGATCPGKARLVLHPLESHAEHCGAVAVYGVLLAPAYGADPALPALCGLAHHLHNALLPDPGHAGDVLLGELGQRLKARAAASAMRELPGALWEPVRAALDLVFRADAPEACAFQAADVLDRVLEMRWHATAAGFTLGQALGELELVHDGPVASFHHRVLADAGLVGPA